MQPGNDKIVADRIVEVLSQKTYKSKRNELLRRLTSGSMGCRY